MFEESCEISTKNYGMGTSRWHIVEGTINQNKYIKVIESRLVAQIKGWYGNDPWIFQQDSVPCHTAKKG